MISFPFAKVNIGLHIIGKRDDGYHNIESIFSPVKCFDALEITPSASGKIEFHTHGKGIPGNMADNLCLKAFALLQNKYGVKPLRMDLLKQIPMGAGLGGGSSNAAHLLMLCNTYFKLYLPDQTLHDLAIQLGSDVPFFLQKETMYVTGRGEQVKPSPMDLKGSHIILVDSNIHSSTADAFAHINISKGVNLAHKTIADLKSNPKQFTNAFEPYLFQKFPVLSEIKRQLTLAGCFYTSMTGSGSTIYGISEKVIKPSPAFVEFCTINHFNYQQTTFL